MPRPQNTIPDLYNRVLAPRRWIPSHPHPLQYLVDALGVNEVFDLGLLEHEVGERNAG